MDMMFIYRNPYGNISYFKKEVSDKLPLMRISTHDRICFLESELSCPTTPEGIRTEDFCLEILSYNIGAATINIEVFVEMSLKGSSYLQEVQSDILGKYLYKFMKSL